MGIVFQNNLQLLSETKSSPQAGQSLLPTWLFTSPHKHDITVDGVGGGIMLPDELELAALTQKAFNVFDPNQSIVVC